MDRFLGFVKRDGASYGGTVAEFQRDDGERFVLDAKTAMIRQHNRRSRGLDTSEEDRAVDDFQRYFDAQHWFDARRDFGEWLDKQEPAP